MISGLVLDQAKTVVIRAIAELTATLVASDRARDRLHPADDGKAVGTDVGVVAFHLPPLEGQVVIRLLPGDSQVRTSGLPLWAMRIDPPAATALVSDEVGKFVLERAPEFFRLAILELRIEFDRAVRPPRAARRRLHPRVPGNSDFARKLMQSERF